MRLIGDIGGTHARFARSSERGSYQDERKLRVLDHLGLVEAARAYLAEGPPVKEAVVAVATPLRGDRVKLTNSPWHFSIAEAKHALGLDRLSVINDFAAQAEAVAALRPEDLRELKAGTHAPDRPRLVIGPGTGLGVAFLLDHGGHPRVVSSEAGHSSFAPQDEIQSELLLRLRRSHAHVSVERLLSGPGLLSIARLLAEIDGQPLDIYDPRDVSARAAGGRCAYCTEAMRVFSAILGAAAGDLALNVLAEGGVFITGGLCRGLGPLLDVQALAQAFIAKGRFGDYLDAIRIDQVLRPHIGLLGASVHRHAE